LASTLEGLGAAAPFLRTTLGKTLHVRRVPELRFQPDRSYEHAQRIEEVLSEVIPAGETDDEDAADSDDSADSDEVAEPDARP
jgi:ribosome-binding factor A